MVDKSVIAEELRQLCREKNAVILAHYYTRPEVQRVADFTGDSLALSVKAAATDADIILFAGVNFMAETAKVLSPDKKVLLPVPEAGCSLADSCPADKFAAFTARYPDHTVVSYVNTSVGVKAVTDICCTSSNALRIVSSLPRDRGIIFGPDRNLGSYIKRVTGRQDIILWDGACHVHEGFSLEGILRLRAEHPEAKVVAHPECRAYILEVADFVGSTAAILDFCGRDSAREYIVVTEPGILYEMEEKYLDKHFIPAPAEEEESCGCNDCAFMKMVTLEKMRDALRNESPEVVIDEELRRKAERSIRAMIDCGA